MENGKFASFYQYQRYCKQYGSLLFCLPSAIYDPCLALLAPVLKEVAYLCMLFILEVSCQAVQVISRIDNAFKKPKVAAYDQSEIELS